MGRQACVVQVDRGPGDAQPSLQADPSFAAEALRPQATAGLDSVVGLVGSRYRQVSWELWLYYELSMWPWTSRPSLGSNFPIFTKTVGEGVTVVFWQAPVQLHQGETAQLEDT